MYSSYLNRVPIIFVLALGSAACASSGTAGDSAPWITELDNGAFVTTIGTDTVAIEQFVLRRNVLDVQAVTRSPRTMVRNARLEWSDDGVLRRYETAEREPERIDSIQTVLGFTTRRDSVYWQLEEGLRRQPLERAAARDPRLVFLPYVAAMYVVPARLVHVRGDSVAVMVTRAGSVELRVASTAPGWLTFFHADFGSVKVRVDDAGRVQEVDARESTLGSHSIRVALLERVALTRRFAARDAEGRGLGPLSPPDTARARVGDASVTIAYARPSRRGRTIFGEVVPWNRVWRTGANEATVLTTDRDLVIGGTRVPAGSYTLWSVPSPEGWELIVNRQTGQWGTRYDPSMDLARIPLRLEKLDQPVEQFTIAVDPAGNEALLSLAWETRKGVASVRAGR